MYRQKTIINRQRRNVSQIANVQRKVRQNDRSPCKHTVKYRQSSPCKCGKIIDKYIDKIRTTKSTKFTLQMQCNYRKYRSNSPCKCNAIDNTRLLRNRSGLLRNHNALLRNRKTRNFFVVKLHLSYPQRLQTP